MQITLRDYQADQMVKPVRQAFQSGALAPLLVGPTGCGKTVVFSYIADAATQLGNNTLILVHRKELLNQTSRTLDDFRVPHGLIAPGMTFQRQPVQVASVQTLVRRMHLLRWKPDLIIVDEAHHATGKSTWGKVLEYYDTAILGVTATPERLDGTGLGATNGGFFDVMIQGPTVRELIDQDYLSQPVVYAPSTVDLSGVHTRMGDFSKSEASEAVDKPCITGDAVKHYRRLCHNEPAVVFCASVAHAEHVAEEFRVNGYQAASIDGTLDDVSRKQRIEDLGNGRLNVLTSCEIISEGIDIPVISAAILLRPTQSIGLYLQQVGRALRPFPGKTHATILDHVGNCMRHGLPDDDREWSLEGKKRSTKSKTDEASLPIRQCEKCYHVHKPAPRCPKCGEVYAIKAREIEQVEGELERVDPEQIRWQMKREQGRAKSLEDLQAIGKARGFKPGWARYVFKARSNRRVAA